MLYAYVLGLTVLLSRIEVQNTKIDKMLGGYLPDLHLPVIVNQYSLIILNKCYLVV